MQKQKTCSLSTFQSICFATGSFGSQGNFFVAYHLAMPVLCALTVAQAAAASLRAQCRNEEEMEKMAEDLEVIKEVLAQVSVDKTYVQHFSMTKFCDRVLWSTRGLLLQWDIPSTSLQEVPVPHMPGLEKNKVWTIEHSNREMYLSEVTASLNDCWPSKTIWRENRGIGYSIFFTSWNITFCDKPWWTGTAKRKHWKAQIAKDFGCIFPSVLHVLYESPISCYIFINIYIYTLYIYIFIVYIYILYDDNITLCEFISSVPIAAVSGLYRLLCSRAGAKAALRRGAQEPKQLLLDPIGNMSTSSSSTHKHADSRDVATAMARYSETSILKIRNLLSGKGSSKNMSGAFKRKLRAALGPYRGCYKEVSIVESGSGQKHITFYMADVQRLLSLYVRECPALHALLKRQAARTLEVFLAHDEATAGNVLNPLQRMKTLLVYFTLKPLSPYFESARAWMPLAAITHEQLQQCPGGVSAVTARIVEEWLDQNLTGDVVVAGDMAPLSLAIVGFVSDMESQRAAYAAKGSAALKPCLHCGNCVMKGAYCAAASHDFLTIEEADLRRFTANDPTDVERYIVHWMAQKANMTKAEIDLRQKCLGFLLDEHSLWAYPRARSVCNIGIAINDCMHSYWANGICNTEIMLVLNAAREHTGVEVKDLCESMVTAGWKRHSKNEGMHWCKRLWTPALFGNEYKGSASQCLALMALIRWHCETVWIHVPALRPVAECFLALARCTDAVRRDNNNNDWSELDARQEMHHRLFAQVHPGTMRPKHHHRLHLADHFRKHRVRISCWGVEQAHQNYKSVFADNFFQLLRSGDEAHAYSQHLLPRLLLRSIEITREHPFVENGFALVSPFSETEVESTTGLRDVQISRSCRLFCTELREDSIVLWGERCENAGICRFFLQRSKKLFIYIALLELTEHGESYRCFNMNGGNDFVPLEIMHNLHLPAFTSAESAKIICLLWFQSNLPQKNSSRRRIPRKIPKCCNST